MSRRKRKRKQRGMKTGCVSAAGQVDDLRDLAKDHGLTVRVSEMVGRGRKSLHFMFDAVGVRVLDYWPGNGTFWAPATGEKGKVPDCWQALDVAARIACGANTR